MLAVNKQELLKHYHIKPKSIQKLGSATIITEALHNKKYVIKSNHRKADSFDYLKSRNFNNFPQVYSTINDEVELFDYIEDSKIPIEQKLEDTIYLASILHTKTTFYKEVEEDYIKKIYEEVSEKLEYIYHFYSDIQNMIELEVYMSPANYALIRNISLIYLAVNQSKKYIDKWYDIIKDTHKLRFAYVHGNLDHNHLLESDNLYLISWDNSRIDLPIYDLEIFYRKNYSNISLQEILNIYESKYPLKKEEYYLLLALLLIPEKIDLEKREYQRVKQVTNLILYIDKTLSFLENNAKETNHHTEH